MRLKKLLVLLAGCSLSGCIHLDVTPWTIDAIAEKAYVIPTKPTKDNPVRDEDIGPVSHKLNKMTCFSADDLAQIERKLNQCK